MKKTLTTAAIAASLLCATAHATPIMFSSLNGFNAPDANSVGGVRFSVLHGKVGEVKGVDFPILSMSETDTTVGVNFPIFFVGASKVNKSMTGASFGIFNWMPGETVGVNFGTVNVTNNVKGANLGFVNYAEGNTVVDFGAVSISKESTVQLGIFNMTDKIDGVQIGLINCAANGFLPCFPFINF